MENADTFYAPLTLFLLTKNIVRHSLLAVIVLIFILKMQLYLPLAVKLSLTFTGRDRYHPWDASEEGKTQYSTESSPVSWNFYPDGAYHHYLVG